MPDQDSGTPPTQGDTPVSPPEKLPMPPTSTQVVRAEGAGTQSDWKRKYDSIRGEVDAKQSQWDTWLSRSDTVAQQLRAELTDLQGQLSTVQGERDVHAQALEALPALQQTATKAEELQALNERLNQVLRYPGLLSQTQVETTEVDGQPVETRTNPFLDAVLGSNLIGDPFTTLLTQMEARVGTRTNPQAPPSALPHEMNVPSAPTPSPDAGTVAELQRQIDEAHQAGDYPLMARLQDELMTNTEYLETLSRAK